LARLTPGRERERDVPAVGCSCGEHRRRRGSAGCNPIDLGGIVGNARQCFGVQGVESLADRLGQRRHGRDSEPDEHVVRGGGHGGVLRRIGRRRWKPGEIRLARAVDGVDGVVHRALHHCQMERRGLRRLAGAGSRRGGCVDQRVHGVEVPVADDAGVRLWRGRVSTSERCGGERDEGDERSQQGAAAS
jgi:hypothetical protein